jgi:phosphatidylinositol kinase/protein kinase (PI-3  family)
LRQDAVLSNIFSNVNILLKKSIETRKRNLSIRTYKVIPLGNRVGVLEWVNDTMTMGDYLLDAHVRYKPKEMPPLEARKLMMKEHEREGSDPQSKLAVYQNITSSLSPVFRHFFFEHFIDPSQWFVDQILLFYYRVN